MHRIDYYFKKHKQMGYNFISRRKIPRYMQEKKLFRPRAKRFPM